jgi:hypothetical protein
VADLNIKGYTSNNISLTPNQSKKAERIQDSFGFFCATFTLFYNFDGFNNWGEVDLHFEIYKMSFE